MTRRSAPEGLYKSSRRRNHDLSTARVVFDYLADSMPPSSALRGSRERQDLLGNAALLPKVQQKPLGSHAEQRNRVSMNGKKWTTLCSVVTKLPTHILIATVCIPDSASFSSLVVDPYTRLDEVSRVRKKLR